MQVINYLKFYDKIWKDYEEESEINILNEFECFKIIYNQIRSFSTAIKIIVTPTNGIFPKEQLSWQNEMFPLAERVIKYLENAQITDENLHICPIYAHVSRNNAGCLEENISYISVNNNAKFATTYDVHVLDKETSMQEYIQPLESVVLGII